MNPARVMCPYSSLLLPHPTEVNSNAPSNTPPCHAHVHVIASTVVQQPATLI